MFAIMIIVFSDVVMRYAFNRPFSWAYDLISLYLMAGIFFLVLSEAYTSRAHVSVDILQQKFSPAMIRLSEIVTCVVGHHRILPDRLSRISCAPSTASGLPT